MRISHADAMQIISFCMAPFLAFKLFTINWGFWRENKTANTYVIEIAL
jgi:hypothetical protein